LSWRLIAVLLAAVFLLSPLVLGQFSNDALSLSYQIFDRLQEIYRVGQAPRLVDKLNSALELINKAELSRSQGDHDNAASLEEQATTMLNEISSDIPAAELNAQREASDRTLFVVAMVPVTVIISTFGFCISLMVWRRYEKMKLYEMIVVEGKKKDN
jgi:hypothetical protein